jgi:hypothetical protein
LREAFLSPRKCRDSGRKSRKGVMR